MLENLGQIEIERILHEEAIGRIGFHANGRTFVVPVTYAYDGERVICHSGRCDKYTMMRDNPHVCFEVEQITDVAHWSSVLSDGQFEELEGEDVANASTYLIDRLDSLMVNSQVKPLAAEPHSLVTDSVVFSIKLGEKSGRYERP